MVIVAVAGGAGHMGRTIVEAILADKKHEVKILSRKASSELENSLGVPVISVDYSNIDALTAILETHGVHTVVSALSTYDDAAGNVPPEVPLIAAADRSQTTRRFITSCWSAPHCIRHSNQMSSVTNLQNAKAALDKATDLVSTVFYNGAFMDYWGLPAVPSHMPPFTMILDIPNNSAAIPGSGNVPVTFTHTRDVARFVSASLDLDEWDRETYIMGDSVTLNQFLHLAEGAKGTKFTVVHDTVDTLKDGKTTELPSQAPLYAFFPKEMLHYLISLHGLWFENGIYNLEPKMFLNEKLPQITPLKLKEMLEQAWAA